MPKLEKVCKAKGGDIRLSRAKVACYGATRTRRPVRACPVRRYRGSPNEARRGMASAFPQEGKRSAQASGIEARRVETPQAARCAARKPGPAGETPRKFKTLTTPPTAPGANTATAKREGRRQGQGAKPPLPLIAGMPRGGAQRPRAPGRLAAGRGSVRARVETRRANLGAIGAADDRNGFGAASRA